MSYIYQSKPIFSFLNDIVPDCYLPAIQRELVWSPEEIEDLFDSIVRGYPFGTLLLWAVRIPAIHDYSFYKLIQSFNAELGHNEKANLQNRTDCYGILDGQQRITALLLGLMGSYRMKLKGKWKSSLDAWVIKKLYLNLLHCPSTDEEGRYEFKFLTDREAKKSDDAHYWFQIGTILTLRTIQDMCDWQRQTPYYANKIFEKNLNALWEAINRLNGISYFLEDNQNLNEVLTIFVRLNMGGKKLSYSDLLLSLATATWESHDAREEVIGLVDKLNRECGVPFAFDKDFVLKSLLVLNGGDVRFRTENIQRNVNLENKWETAQKVLPLAVRLAASFGFNEKTLTANNAIIPVAYYIYQTGRDERFLNANEFRDDREQIRIYLLTMLLGHVFGRQSDDVLRRIREVLDTLSAGQAFPVQNVIQGLKSSQNIGFSVEAVKVLVDEANYGSSLAFQLLALASPVKLGPSVQYHVDHVHPKAHFNSEKMRSAGMPDQDIAWALERRDDLSNLQLLPGLVNQSKNETPYAEWLEKQGESESVYYRFVGLIPDNADLSFASFRTFYDNRHQFLLDKILQKLGVDQGNKTSAEQS